jgi:uncharacterized protein
VPLLQAESASAAKIAISLFIIAPALRCYHRQRKRGFIDSFIQQLAGNYHMRILSLISATLFLVALPITAQAQFSESYNFLKATKDRDFAKANEIISKPGSVILDTREPATGDSALHIVTRGRDLPWMNLLLSRRAKTDLRDKDGNTPLMIATQIRFREGVQTLLASRAGVNVANNSGETPLIRAVQLRDVSIVRTLLNAGANPDKRDTLAGLSAREYAARDSRSAAILKIIEEPRAAPAAAKSSGPKF